MAFLICLTLHAFLKGPIISSPNLNHSIRIRHIMFTKERLLLLTLAAVQFTNIMDFMIVMPLAPQLMRLFGITPQQFALIVSSYTISAGITGFFGAFFIDKFDRKTTLLTAYIGFTIGTLACAFAPNYAFLLSARILTGMFGGVIGAIVLSIVGDAVPIERRGAAMGVVMASFSLASVFGVPVGLYLATLWSWHAPFFFLAGIAALACVVIFFVVPNMRGHITKKHTNPFNILANIAGNRSQLFALLLMFLLMIGQFGVLPFISKYMVANVGFTEKQLTYIYIFGGAATIFTSPLVGKLADRFGNKRIFAIFIIISFIPLFLITNMPKIAIGWVLLVTTVFFVTSGGRMIPATTMITATVSPQNRGSFMSINSSVQHISAGVGSFIGGSIVTEGIDGKLQNFPVVGYIAIVTSLIAIAVSSQLKMQGNQHMSIEKMPEAA